MGLSYSDDANTYKVWLGDETKPVEVKAERFREEGSFVFFMAQSSNVVLAVPTARVKSIRHSSLPDPVKGKARTT